MGDKVAFKVRDGFLLQSCKNCGESAIKKRPADFCGDECRSKWHEKHPEKVEKPKEKPKSVRANIYQTEMFVDHDD